MTLPCGWHDAERRAWQPPCSGKGEADVAGLVEDFLFLPSSYRHKTWVVPSTGGTPRVVQPKSEGGSWAPNGRHLAVTGHGPSGNELFLVAADGSGSRKIADITTEGFITFDTFSPDGRSVLLGGSSDVHFAFTVVPLDGSAALSLDESVIGGDPQRLP